MKRYITSLMIIILVFALVGCGQSDNPAENLVVKTTYDYPVAMDIHSIIHESDVIVVGKYVKFHSSWNMARDPNDINKEDPNLYVEGKVFEFQVDQYLYGKGDSLILVNHKYKHDGIIDERYIEPLLGESVVLFLQKGVFNQYYGAMQPFQFKLKNNHLAVMSNLTQVKEAFKKSISLDELISAIGKQGLSY